MKKCIKLIICIVYLSLITVISGCGGSSSDSRDTGGGGTPGLTKIIPLLEPYIPHQADSSKKTANGPMKSWTLNYDMSAGEDSYVYRYLSDDINGVYTNSKIYDALVDLVNSKLDANYTPSSGVTVKTATSFTTNCLGTITGTFHDIYMGDNSITIFPAVTGVHGEIIMKNLHIIIEKSATVEKVYAYIEVYENTAIFDTILYSCKIEGSTINFELFSYEDDPSKKRLAIEKKADGSFTIKEFEGSTSLCKGIVAGDMTSVYIRHLEVGYELMASDECFKIDSTTFAKILPAGDTGTLADWSGTFPTEVSDTDLFPGFNINTSIVDRTSLQWWN